MNFLTAGAKLRRDANKMADGLMLINPSLTREEAYEQAVASHMVTIEEDIKCGLAIRDKFLEIQRAQRGTHVRYYFITVRPDEARCDFPTFYKAVQKYMARKCFEDFELVFEQKGTTPEDLGRGFHIHILAHMRQRSKPEVLRDTFSSFNKLAAENCIEIEMVRTQQDEDRVRAYMMEHESKDGHKQLTRAWDEMWRVKLGLEQVYTGLPGGLSSPDGPPESQA